MKWLRIIGVPRNRKADRRIPVFQRTRLCCYSTDKAVKRSPFWAGHHCSRLLLLSLQGPILYTCHVLLPLPWPNFFWKLCFPNCRKSRSGTRAFKRNCPLEFNYACCWVLLQKVLCQEFLIMLLFFAHRATSWSHRLWAGGVSIWVEN